MNRIEKTIYFSFLLFPIFLITLKPISLILFGIIAICGIILTVKEKINPFSNSYTKVYTYITFGYFIIMLFVTLLEKEYSYNSWSGLVRLSYFALAPFIAVALYHLKIPLKKANIAFSLGVIAAGTVVIIEAFIKNLYRYSGMYNANTYGDLLVLLIFFALVSNKLETIKEKILAAAVILIGISGTILSASRASMLVFLIVCVIYFLFLQKNSKKNFLRNIIIVFLSIGAIILALQTKPFEKTLQRFDLIQKQINAYFKKGNRYSSIGARIEMYKDGTKAFLDSPLIGYGYQNGCAVASKYVSNRKKNEQICTWHLHNELLTNAVNAGLLGIFALLSLYFVPLYIFFKNRNKSIYAKMGIIFIFSIILIGITHNMIGYEYESAFIVLMLAYTLINVQREKDEKNIS